MVWRFTEWSQPGGRDMDGQVAGPSERERTSQTPYKIALFEDTGPSLNHRCPTIILKT
jgi:hypothetical protein